jgi:hypothetical protein
MSNPNLRNITNNFPDVRLVSALPGNEIAPYDRGAPYVVMQEGYDPQDLSLTPDQFVLSRSGKWLSLSDFYRLPGPLRRADFVFSTAAEVMQIMNQLPSQAELMQPTHSSGEPSLPASSPFAKPGNPQTHQMAIAFKAPKRNSPLTRT